MGTLGRFALVFVGGGVGSVGRYLVQLGLLRWTGATLPWGTWVVNVLGSFLIGLLARWNGRVLPEKESLLLITGLLGGFTTYSAFNHEVLQLGAGRALWGFFYALATVGAALGAGALGVFLAGRWSGGAPA